MTDFGLYLSDVSKKPSATGVWLKGPAISKEDLKHGRGGVEKISAQEALEEGGGRAPKQEYRSWSPAPKAENQNEPLMGFGKHKEKTMKWVKSNDPHYWEWCLNSIEWFSKKVEKYNI